MGENGAPADLQEAVERSYRAQWGGKRFCLVAAIVLFVLAVLSAVAMSVAPVWFSLTSGVLKLVEISGLAISFVCLIASVMFAMEALMRSQRERGEELPDRTIHSALSLSVVTVAGLVFLLFLISWTSSGLAQHVVRIIEFIIYIFCGLAWLGAVGMSSAAIAMLVTRRSDLLEVNNTSEGTALVFRRGHSGEIVKLSIAALIPLIIFVVLLLLTGITYIL